ncbi:MAG: glycogen debranching protein GlgX [Myxococcales bacterium]|nr:glycogen debranching protein GlgX [Myxococcales bacterium]MCB9629807.1 glycogen debranching protein GlgX [Sandaracinaceae bacterium]
MIVWPGVPYPLGAVFDGTGTNFAVFSASAKSVELCLFDEHGVEQRIELPESTGGVFHGYLPEVVAGQRYGFRVHGEYDPRRGLRADPTKLLLDPYARAIEGRVTWSEHVFSHPLHAGRQSADSAAYVPRSIVVNPYFVWGDDKRPRTSWHDTVIYEAHVRGLTMTHPDIPEKLRGTYAGLAHPAMLRHYAMLGVTAIELMPVHHFVHDHRLAQLGLRNYWGYNSIGYFAPHGQYSSVGDHGGQVAEFKAMVRGLHAAGIEVILDVVYNHTGEGDHNGPTLCFRGLDNAAYYRLAPDNERYIDYTGCGNSMNMRHPHVLQLIMDSLRYWVLEMHVDGFRFDLASALARELHEVDRLSAFFDLIQQDPVISQVKLIAEPWDVGEGGYQVGNFPPLWSEWNGQYRDTVRDFWRGAERKLGEFAYRFTGSSDLYASGGRSPHASINFVTCHDGFTLRDLVSYEEKHNQANGEQNRDGESHNRTWNCGVEGDTTDPAVLALRAKQTRNFLVTLFLSQGVPMLLAGDELGRTQRGNNNAYCQDGPLSWVDWVGRDLALGDFCRRLIRLRRRHPVFRRRRWFEGVQVHSSNLSDIGWFKPDGGPMSEHDWQVAFARALGVFLNGDALPAAGLRGERVQDDSFYLFFNAGSAPVSYVIPSELGEPEWQLLIDTDVGFVEKRTRWASGVTMDIDPHSLRLYRRSYAAAGALPG